MVVKLRALSTRIIVIKVSMVVITKGTICFVKQLGGILAGRAGVIIVTSQALISAFYKLGKRDMSMLTFTGLSGLIIVFTRRGTLKRQCYSCYESYK